MKFHLHSIYEKLRMATERYATADVTLGEITIQRGAPVYVVLASANREEGRFSDAACFDIAREPNRHLAFGHGIHYGLGVPLANLRTRSRSGGRSSDLAKSLCR